MPPVRILQIVTHMARAGLESRLMEIYRTIDREKVQFDFYTHRKEEGFFDNEIRSLGGRVYYNHNINISSIFSGGYKRTFSSFLKDHPDYQILHCHLTELSGMPLGTAKKMGISVRIAHSRSEKALDPFPKDCFKSIVKHFVWGTCTHAFAVSKKAGRWLYGNKPFTVIPNAINAERYRFNEDARLRVRQQFDLSDSLVVGLVGRFSGIKNHSFLIDVFAALKKMHPKSKLLLVGDGPLEAQLKQKIENLSLSKGVVFAGLQTDVAPYLMAMDVFVMPSLYEGLPGAAVEAQATGLPCILSGSITDEAGVVPDICEFLPLTLPPDEWAKKIIELSRKQRRDTYEEIASAGFNIVDIAKKYEKFYLNPSLEVFKNKVN